LFHGSVYSSGLFGSVRLPVGCLLVCFARLPLRLYARVLQFVIPLVTSYGYGWTTFPTFVTGPGFLGLFYVVRLIGSVLFHIAFVTLRSR
jgi:hypothetical protein